MYEIAEHSVTHHPPANCQWNYYARNMTLVLFINQDDDADDIVKVTIYNVVVIVVGNEYQDNNNYNDDGGGDYGCW